MIADSGAVDHCAGPRDLPDGLKVDPSEEERNFVGADGEPIDHYGKCRVRLEQTNGAHVGSSFQVMNVCRPLHSVSKITDQKCDMLFTSEGAIVVDKGVFDQVLATVKRIAEYPRSGNLYVAKMKVKIPKPPESSPFGGPGQGK